MIKLADVGVEKSDAITHIANLAPAYVFDFESLAAVAKTIVSSRHRRIPVINKNNHVVGILTYMDILDGVLRGLSRNTKASSFMTRDAIVCEPNDSINNALQKMRISRRGGLPLVKNGKLIGMVAERDIIKLVYGKYLDIPVKDVMTQRPFFMRPDTSALECVRTMVNTHYRRFPVVDGKNLVGMITGIDMLKYLDDTGYNPTRLNEPIENIMTTPVIFVVEHDDLSDAIKLIIENEVGGLPVINEENNVIGIITERDILEIL